MLKLNKFKITVLSLLFVLGSATNFVSVTAINDISTEDKTKETDATNEIKKEVVDEAQKAMKNSTSKVKQLPTRHSKKLRSIQDEVKVASEQELRDEFADLENIEGDTKTIIITGDIVFANQINIPMNQGKNVVIKSQNMVVLQAPKGRNIFNVLNGANFLTFEKITFKGLIGGEHLSNGVIDWATVGSTPSGGAIGGDLGQGEVSFENTVFTRINGSAFSLNAKKANFNNTSFISNFTPYGGAAIRYDGTNTPTFISNSTFYDNSSVTSGYTGGAIHLKSGTAAFSIKNSVFKSNRMMGGGTIMQGGGAIALAQSNRTFSVDGSVFDDNRVFEPYTNDGTLHGQNADGGAIYIFTSQGAHRITNSTFTNNTSYDEGGAISFILTSNSANKVVNSTFVGNVAQGLQVLDGSDAGGAIELNGNTTTRTVVTLESNTIVGNTGEKGNAPLNNYGGGVSLKYADANFNNNIIAGNKATAAKYDNVYVGLSSTLNGVTNNVSSVMAQDGKNLGDNIFFKDVFGTETPNLIAQENKAGATNTDFTMPIKIQPIKPEGLADDKGVSKENSDQNKNTRDLDNSDYGAVEIKWIKHISNLENSNWTLLKLIDFDGKIYYEQENPSTIYHIYAMNEQASTYKKPNAADNKSFVAWNTDENGQGKKYQALSNNVLRTSDNVTLYGQWKAEQVTISFDVQGGTEVAKQIVDKGTKASKPNNPNKDGYTFVGWYQEESITNEWDFENDVARTDITLYAKWKTNIVMYQLTYDANGADSGHVPIDTKTYEANESVEILMGTALGKTSHTFIGWNTQKDGQGTMYQVRDSFKITDNIILYAIWQKNKGIVTPLPEAKKPPKEATDDMPILNEPSDKPLPKSGVDSTIIIIISVVGLALIGAKVYHNKKND